MESPLFPSPKIMGILNVTPNSFFDGGRFTDTAAALARAEEMLHEGADIIDVGGESTGPGSSDVPLKEELRRVIPVIKEIKTRHPDAVISVDTYKAEVARQAIDVGAQIINDVTALRGDAQMADVAAESGAPVVLMYAKDLTPRTTRERVQYEDVVKTIYEFLKERMEYALSRGVKREWIIIDPGMGAFVSGDPRYSYEVLRRLGEFKNLGFPILIGVSRKSFLPGVLHERLEPSLAAGMLALLNGASILRVHDVGAHKKMLGTFECCQVNAVKQPVY